MTKFAWEGKKPRGGAVSGRWKPRARRSFSRQLRREQIQPQKIRKKGVDLEIRLPWKGRRRSAEGDGHLHPSVRHHDRRGPPLVQCLDILGLQQENPTFKKVILKIKEDVESGSTFADALSKHPKVFEPLFVTSSPRERSAGCSTRSCRDWRITSRSR